MKKLKTICVTGGTGFIGSNLCARLASEGYRVICVDNNYTGNMRNIQQLFTNPNFHFIMHDMILPLNIDEHIDQIYNLACPASPTAFQKDPLYTSKTCIFGALNALDMAKCHNASILQASTSEIYGEPLEYPQNESYHGNVNPIGIRACYDEGKRCAESIFFDFHRQYGTDIKIVRIFNTYGPNMAINDGRVVSNFIIQALQNNDITIYGTGKQTRSLCYIDDTIEFLIRIMNHQNITGPINIGNPEEFTIYDIAEKIIKKTRGNSKIVHLPLPSDDPTRRRPDISLAKNITQYVPKIMLNEGLDKTIEYFRQVLSY